MASEEKAEDDEGPPPGYPPIEGGEAETTKTKKDGENQTPPTVEYQFNNDEDKERIPTQIPIEEAAREKAEIKNVEEAERKTTESQSFDVGEKESMEIMEDGPPPGFQSIEVGEMDSKEDVALPGYQSLDGGEMEVTRMEGGEKEEGEEEIEKTKLKEEEGLLRGDQSIEGERREIEEDEEGPPPGYHSIEEVEGEKREIKVEEEDEGPPPGYQSIAPLQMGPPTPMPTPEQPKPLQTPMPPTPVPTPILTPEPPKPLQTPMPLPVPTSRTPPEIAQMVCGSCRRLLKYSPGATHVQCSCCQTVNFVLEAHQVGLVECGNCTALLMYPYGAPSVRCSSCQFVTEIGEHNQRPPWSVQQGQQIPCSNSLQETSCLNYVSR